MNMVEVFEERIIKVTKQNLKKTLAKLKTDVLIQQKLRGLVYVTSRLEKLNVVFNDPSWNMQEREKWVIERNELNEQRDRIYSELTFEGFESSWITKIIEFEMESYKKIISKASKDARQRYFGDISFDDIDIMDDRWDLVGAEINKAKENYIQGN